MRIKKAVAIRTKYLGPTAMFRARIKASVVGSKLAYTMEYMHATDEYQNHSMAAMLLVNLAGNLRNPNVVPPENLPHPPEKLFPLRGPLPEFATYYESAPGEYVFTIPLE